MQEGTQSHRALRLVAMIGGLVILAAVLGGLWLVLAPL